MSVIDNMEARRPQLLGTLEQLVKLESPSLDKAAVDRLGNYIHSQLDELGAAVEVHQRDTVGDILVASWPGTDGAADGPLLVMTHIDTVWPLGTLDRLPFAIDGDIARGPGVYDMKASVAMMLAAMTEIQERSLSHRPITWLITTDEEIGSNASRDLIEELASRGSYVLCLEPPVPPNGFLKTARKGVGGFQLTVNGVAAHAGADPEKGVSAIQEMALQIEYLHGLTDFSKGTTVNVGVIQGGTRPNVIAAQAIAEIDLRVTTMAEAERVVDAIRSARPHLPGATVQVEGGMNRPPMERTEAIVAAFQRAREIGAGLGLVLGEASTGGASDGNFTAAIGATTIDGLGCLGDGAHADHEHIRISGLVERAGLLTALLTEL
ncbi:MAG TPA: M20 family metallopeptidase [Thermomicrobiaceae bacterium]|nr:M20 family metallopeptidase [Thermomicrobiaceae bacterium]